MGNCHVILDGVHPFGGTRAAVYGLVPAHAVDLDDWFIAVAHGYRFSHGANIVWHRHGGLAVFVCTIQQNPSDVGSFAWTRRDFKLIDKRLVLVDLLHRVFHALNVFLRGTRVPNQHIFVVSHRAIADETFQYLKAYC